MSGPLSVAPQPATNACRPPRKVLRSMVEGGRQTGATKAEEEKVRLGGHKCTCLELSLVEVPGDSLTRFLYLERGKKQTSMETQLVIFSGLGE